MNIFKSILIFIILYVYLLLSKLDKYDVYALKNFDFINKIKFLCFTHSKISNKKKKLKDIHYAINTLLIPFKEKIHFLRMTFGCIYLSYVKKYKLYSENKLLWINIFKKYNINHPKLYAYNNNGHIKYLENIDNFQEYVSKPIMGLLGIDVTKIKGNQVKEFLEQNQNVLIQEKLFDCVQKSARFFRYVTSYKGDKIVLIEYVSEKGFIPNTSHGGYFNVCHDLNCESISSNPKLKQKMINIMNQLVILHKNEFPKILSIGWDLMINCENSSKDKIKIYCLEGNSPHIVWYAYPEFDDTILKYKQIVKDFYDENIFTQ